MLQIRKFGPEIKTPVPRTSSKGLYASMVQVPAEFVGKLPAGELERRFNGSPLILDRPNMVVALYLDPYSEMDEHDAPEPILCLVTGGSGYVRIGGPEGEIGSIGQGDALIWPAKVLHKIWTEAEPLQCIVFHYAA